MKIGVSTEEIWDVWCEIYELNSPDGLNESKYIRGVKIFTNYGKDKNEEITKFLLRCNINTRYKIYNELRKLRNE